MKSSKNKLIINANIIPITGVPFQGWILIKENQIIDFGEANYIPNEDFNDNSNNFEVIDAKNGIVMPGLINAHTHMSMGYFRNFADDLPLKQWLEDKIWPAEARLNGEFVRTGTDIAILECIRSGTTTFRDMYFFMDEVAKSTIDSGIRGVLGRGIVSFGDNEKAKIKDACRVFDEWNGKGNGRITVEFAPHAPYTNSDEYLIEVHKESKSRGATYHIHLSESLYEVEESEKTRGMTPPEHLEKLGVLDGNTSLAHCVHLRDGDFDILAKAGVSVLHNPSSNLKLGNGFANVPKMLSMGINVAIGTDGASSNNNLNMIEEIHLASLISKGAFGDPTLLPASEVLRMATINGAKSIGMEDIIGSIERGKRADLIFIDINKPHLTPLGNIEAAVCYSVQASDIHSVMVDGEFVMRDKKVLTMDEQAIINKMNELTKQLLF